jgi:flagellar L-ring protein precursor FlgH
MQVSGTIRFLLALSVVVLSGCAAQRHIIKSTPTLDQDLRAVESDLDLLPPFPMAKTGSGSLWSDAGMGAALTRDHRAYRVNDLLTIVVAESSSGSNAASTDVSRASKSDFKAPFVFGLTNLDEVFEADSSHSHQGDGKTNRSSQLASNITGRVMRVLPNGAMLVGGQKTVMVNREREVLTLVGVVRPEDVSPGNRVSSAVISDLTVRLWGSGELNETIRQGWFMRIMNKIWPF